MAQKASQYAGTWEASFQGKTFLTLTPVANGDKLTGSVVHDNINVDGEGNLITVKGQDATEHVTMVRKTDRGLDIFARDDEASDSGHYHLDLTGNDEGKLTLIVNDLSAAPKIKPWTVKRKKS
ncbi:MAG: hypothetical protein ACXVZX_01340 [Terriglobales bacterium]